MNWLAVGALFGGIGVLLGAFGAHGLRAALSPEMLAVYETGVRYLMYHALALLALGCGAGRWRGRLVTMAGWLFVAGILVFSGSLCLLAVSGQRWLGTMTPVGGLAFVLGWGCMGVAALLPCVCISTGLVSAGQPLKSYKVTGAGAGHSSDLFQ